MTLVRVLVYRLGPNGPQLVRAEFGEDEECQVCHGARRLRAAGKPVPVTVVCPFCRRLP